MSNIRALAFDTGGTLLDWHSGVTATLTSIGERRAVTRDWPALTNEYRRSALKSMANQMHPSFNMDDVHRRVMKELAGEHHLDAFTEQDIEEVVQAWHRLDAWSDFPPALGRIRKRFKAISFTILSVAIVMDVSRHNGLNWDLVASCELLGVYKPQPEAYRRAAALLQLAPADILMVACHNYDLNAARAEGYKTAFIRRPKEWGIIPTPDPDPNPGVDIVAADFSELADKIGA